MAGMSGPGFVIVERLEEVRAALTAAGDVKIPTAMRYKVSRGSGGMRYTVGAFGKGSAHRHLVIYGHTIRGHQRTIGGFGAGKLGHKGVAGGGGQTTPNSFVQRGAERSGAIAVTAATNSRSPLVLPADG